MEVLHLFLVEKDKLLFVVVAELQFWLVFYILYIENTLVLLQVFVLWNFSVSKSVSNTIFSQLVFLFPLLQSPKVHLTCKGDTDGCWSSHPSRKKQYQENTTEYYY